MTKRKVKYIYIVLRGIEYEGFKIERIFNNEKSAEVYAEFLSLKEKLPLLEEYKGDVDHIAVQKWEVE